MAKLVLIVEDNPFFRKGLQRLISAEGYDSISYASAEEAVTHVKGTRFDLALLDINLPGMQGDDFAKLLLSSKKPIIFVTSESNIDGHLQLKIPGCHVLNKPIHINDLIALLHTYDAPSTLSSSRDRNN